MNQPQKTLTLKSQRTFVTCLKAFCGNLWQSYLTELNIFLYFLLPCIATLLLIFVLFLKISIKVESHVHFRSISDLFLRLYQQHFWSNRILIMELNTFYGIFMSKTIELNIFLWSYLFQYCRFNIIQILTEAQSVGN